MRKNLLDEIKRRRLIFDGATGSVLAERGLSAGKAPELWCLENPEAVIALHKEYLRAGADIIKTNSFGTNPLKYENYEELTLEALRLANLAREDYPDSFVALDIGPLGKLLSPLGSLSFEDAVAAFSAVARLAEAGGADLILIETVNDLYEAKAALLAAKESSSLPVFVSCVFDSRGKLMTGADPAAVVATLEGLGADAVGMNCSLGPVAMARLLPKMCAVCSVPVFANPNAGLPELVDGRTKYNLGAEDFAKATAAMAECGAGLLGGCCGTTPEYIERLARRVRDIPYTPAARKDIALISSYTHAVTFGIKEAPVLIGERINPTGKPKLKEAIKSARFDYLQAEAVRQAECGVPVLDVNVGVPGVNEAEALTLAVRKIQEVCDLPLQLDSSDPEALAAAMRVYNGKPLVNSVNGKRESLDAVLPLVKKYGGVLIALTIDESGIPDTAEGRVAIAEKIIAEAAKYGIDKRDIIVDPLALSVSADSTAAAITLESVKQLSARGIKTSLGVSNISFGLPAREKINSAFTTAAFFSGLTAAIINPYSEPMLDALSTYLAISGLDAGCADYIAKNSGKEPPRVNKTEVVSLSEAVRLGFSDAAVSAAQISLAKSEPLAVISDEIIPALNKVGADFEAGVAYLPELLRSAEAATAALDIVKARIPRADELGEVIALATVRGDVHDIGKNIVKVLLESYGFAVIDLGKDTPAKVIIEAIKSHGCRLVGLSALMTTTLPAMEEAIALIKRETPGVLVMVGGAVLTEEYARKIGADFYGRDAMESVRIAERVFNKQPVKE